MSIDFFVREIFNFSMPLLIVALGGMFAERSGVVNIALEGIMTIGAFVGIVFIFFMQGDITHGLHPQIVLLIGFLLAAAAGTLISLAHAYASVNMRADQIISGTAINMFAGAFAIYIARQIRGVQQIPFRNVPFLIEEVPLLSRIPVVGSMLFQRTFITVYVGILILIAAWVVMFKTRLGLRIRACGEHPHAAQSLGVSVVKMRYIGVLISGALAGLGGLVFILPISNEFDANVAGYGFLALAVLIFGQWKPWRILFAALFFGSLRALSSAYTGIQWTFRGETVRMLDIGIPGVVYEMLPFVATLLVLVFTSKRSQAPKAIGQPFEVGKR